MPTDKDRFDGDNCFVCVNKWGRRFHLYGDNPNELNIRDISNAISKQCRWMGHLKDNCWYSVAEHCVLVARIVKHLGGSVDDQYAALMHDAGEAYLSDIAAPFKRELGSYYDKETLITKRIQAKWSIANAMPDIVREADWLLLWIEAKDLVVADIRTCRTWVGWDQYGSKALQLHRDYPTLRTQQWSHVVAKNRFRTLFASLTKQRRNAHAHDEGHQPKGRNRRREAATGLGAVNA